MRVLYVLEAAAVIASLGAEPGSKLIVYREGFTDVVTRRRTDPTAIGEALLKEQLILLEDDASAPAPPPSPPRQPGSRPSWLRLLK